MISSVFRIFKYAIQNFIRNFWLSLATLLVMVILLLLINMVVGLNQLKASMLTTVNNKIDISLFFKQAVPIADVMRIKGDLERDSHVSEVLIESPDDTMVKFRAQYPTLGDRIIPALNVNPFGYTLRIRAKALEDYTSILSSIDHNDEYAQKLDKARLVDYRSLTATAAQVSERINQGALLLAIIFLLVSVIIMFNSIRVSVYTHRDEIGIMKLVGATNWFIRMPFIIESLIYSVVSMLIVIGLLFFSFGLMQPYLDRFFSNLVQLNLSTYFASNFWQIFLPELAVLVIINVMSTTLALRRYLRF